MKKPPKARCEGECKKLFNAKSLCRIKGKLLCHRCKHKRKNSIPHFPTEIPKSYLPPKRKKRVKKKIIIENKPKIRGATPIKPLTRGLKRGYGLFLTQNEKQILYRKFVSVGMSGAEASKRINNVCRKMQELSLKLRKEAREEKITNEQLTKKFLEGLEKFAREEMRG